MSMGGSTPTVNFDRDFWLDVEVPADQIKENWDDEYEKELLDYADSQRMVGAELEVYWRLFTDDDPPREKRQRATGIINHNPEWGMNLRSAYWFKDGVNDRFVSPYFKEIKPDVKGTGLEDLYDDFLSNGRKFGQIVFLQLFAPRSLKSILTLEYCRGKKPHSISQTENVPDKPLDDINVDSILERLRTDSREYEGWHRFTYDRKSYLVIKRHLRDGVETQVDENQPIESAEYVVAKFRDDLLEIYSAAKPIAGRTMVGVNNSFPDESDVEYDELDETASHDHLDDIGDRIRIAESEGKFTVVGIKAENIPLSGSPSMQLKSQEGLTDALDELSENTKIDLLNDPDSISTIQMTYNDRTFDLYPERKRAPDGENRWRLRYHSRFPSDEERDEFEDAVESAIGLRPVFEHS